MIKVIFSDGTYDLIKKYTNIYIRFTGGQMMPIPCDLRITVLEKDDILSRNRTMDQILKKYMLKTSWTEDEFVKRGFTDYFENEIKLNPEEIEEKLRILEKNKALKNEMYCSIMGEKLVNCWAKVNGKTAKDYAEEYNLTMQEAFFKMLGELACN